MLKLTTLDFLRPRRWQYEIIVQSDSTKQTLHSTSGHVLLGNLSPGYYQISASAILPGYGATPYSAMVNVNVPKQKWWQLSVFSLQLLLLILLIIWFLYRRFKTKQEILSLNKELLEKEQRLELALLDESTGVWDWQGRLDDLENSQLTLVYSPKDIRQMNFSEYLAKIHPEDRQPVIDFWQSFAESNLATVRQIFRVRGKNQWHWLSSRGRVSAIDNQGHPIRITGIWHDISDRKNEEDRIRLLAQCFEANSVIQFLTDEHLQIIDVNSAFDQLTGFNGQKLKGKLLTDILFTRMPKSYGHELRQILKVHSQWSGVSTLARKKELSVPAEIHIKRLGNTKSRPIYLTTVTPRVDESNVSFQDVTSACSDTLTGLPNQAMLLDRVAHLTQECSATDKLILLTISLTQYDFHKQTLGKDTAAKLIIKLSRILNSITGSVDFLARSGEDKFTIAIVTKDPSTSAAMILGRVLDSLQGPIAIGDLRIRITCAFGIAIFPSDEEEPEKLLLRSFEAVELAQKVGPNSFSFYHPEFNQKTADKISMRHELLVALERNEFFLVFQPKIQLQNKKALGFEVFVRWRTKDRGIVYPSTFLPVAKDLHLVDAINAWMIEHSLRVIKRWNDENIATSFSLNLFPDDAVDLMSIKKLINSIKDKKLPASRIHVEINEAALAMDYRKSRQAIDLLVENSIRVTLDDFGNGGVPLNRLIELPIFAVKVSREMVRGIGDSNKAESLLKSVGYLAQQHEWIATAKSIENQHQLEYLRSCGYQIGQGFLFSDPLEENSARDYFVKNR
jgi:diguanylate cyclase (GGDEF)-like protein/PAS domain S-box-containing protein